MAESPPRALVLLAEGAEEMEATITIDVLRRAGAEVTVAGIAGPDPVTCSRGVRVVPDVALAEVADETFDAVVLPGGMGGAEHLAAAEAVGTVLRGQERAGRILAAICAAPIALVSHGIAKGRALTSHPSVQARVAGHGSYREAAVVEDGPLITSRGPGTAFEFALAIAARLRGDDVAAKLRAPMMLSS